MPFLTAFTRTQPTLARNVPRSPYQYILVKTDSLQHRKAHHVESINNIINWLFNTRTGVFVLLGGGVLVFLLVAFLLEKRMRKQFYNHKKSDSDWDFLDDADE